MRIVLSIVFSFISFSVFAQEFDNSYASESSISVIKKYFEMQLLDFNAARFRDLKIIKKSKGTFYCGYVNDKNRFGAYGGFSPFLIAVSDIADVGVGVMYARDADGQVNEPFSRMIIEKCQ